MFEVRGLTATCFVCVLQVMALLAYLYEFKQNYGPHLIIVPNAVMVNWKAELQTWLPDFRCVFYTGSKDERAVKFQSVSSPAFKAEWCLQHACSCPVVHELPPNLP